MERQPFSVVVDASNVTVTSNVEDYRMSRIDGIPVSPVDESDMASLVHDHQLVFGIGVLGQRKD